MRVLRVVVAAGMVALGWAVFETSLWRLLTTALSVFVALAFEPRDGGLAKRERLWRVRCVVFVVMLLVVWLLMPSRRSDPTARVQTLVLDEEGHEQPYPLLAAAFDLLPEAELVHLALLFKDVFPFPTGGVILEELREQDRFDNPFVAEYRLLQATGWHRNLHSALPLQLLQQVGLYRGLRHAVLVLPEGASGPAPVVVFLHGAMGNLQVYASSLARLGEVAVLIPSTQSLVGVWRERDLRFIVDHQLPALAERAAVDSRRVHLAGLSNGGTGVNLALRSRPRVFSSFTFISAWVEQPPESLPRDTAIGVLYGTRDGVGPNNTEALAQLRSAGFRPDGWPFVGERHLVFLARQAQVLRDLRAFWAGSMGSPAGTR